MSDEFDPYQQWLGIAKHEQPANYYRLLGVGTLMEDREAIGNAADRQMNFVRTFQLGQHREASQKILRELAEAKLCLLNPETKAAYDAELRQQQTAAPATAVAPPPAPPTQTPPVTPPPAAPVTPKPLSDIPLVEPKTQPAPARLDAAALARRRSEKSGGLPQWAWIGLAILLTLVVFAWMVSRIAESRRAANRAERDREKEKTEVELPNETDGPSVAQNPDGTVTCAAALAELDGKASIVTEGSDTFITDLEGPGDGAHWTFDLEKGQRGVFKVVVEYACPKGAERGKFRVSVNEKGVKGTHAVHPTGGATTFVRAEIGFVKVQKLERNKLKLAVDARGPAGTTIMNIRAIRLRTVQKGVDKS